MVEKIRIGNNILVKWSILDESGVAYELESRSGYSVELRCGSTPVSASVQSVRGNTITLLYAGRNQRLLGKYHLKYTESAGDLMITFDQRDIFELVEHSWQAGAGVDSGNVTVDVTAHFPVVQGPKGEKGDKGDKGDPGETTITSQGIQGALGYIPYEKPSAGIPSTDLSSFVRDSLRKADSALQEHQDISGKVDKIEGKGLSTNNYTNEDKYKLDNLPTSAELEGELASKQGILTFDDIPTQNSNNPVKSGGVYTALAGKANASDLANYDSIIGIGTAVKEFHPNTPYLKGEFVVHPDSVTGIVNVYEFTAYHPAGAWTGTDVKIANIYNLFANYAGTDTEKVYVQLASSDGLLTLEGIEVTANFSDGGIETKEADANGRCVFDIAKGRVYTISVEQQGGQGYAFCPAQMGEAVADDRYMYLSLIHI